MRNTLETKLGLFFAIVVIAGFLVYELVGGLDFLKGGRRIYGLFDNIQQLKEGDPVKMAGVPVGRVEKVSLAEGKVKVAMMLDEEAAVKTDSKASVKFTGLMGQNFVDVTFGSPQAPELAAEAIIETVEQPDLNVLMAKLDNVATGVENITKSFTGDTLQNILGPLTDFMKENNPKLSAMFDNLTNITSQMSSGKGMVGKMIMDETLYDTSLQAIKSLNETATELKGTVGDAKSTFAEARAILSDINQGKGTLGRMAKDETLYNETAEAMTNMKEIMQKINKGNGTVGKLINDESMYRNVRMTLQKVDKATEGLEDQGPLSVLGIAINSLF